MAMYLRNILGGIKQFCDKQPAAIVVYPMHYDYTRRLLLSVYVLCASYIYSVSERNNE